MVRRIEGTIDYDKHNEVLNDNHKVLIYLDDMTLTDIASQDGSYVRKFHTISKLILENQIQTFPITFVLEYDEKDIERTSNYSLRVRIVADGKTRFITSSHVPVLTKGYGDMVDIKVDKIDLIWRFDDTHAPAGMLVLCILTAVLWGVTNWFLKQGSTGLQKIQYDNRIKQFGAEIWYFFTNAQYWIPFLLNQCGSVLYYYALSKTDFSTAVPVTNALTLLITYICDVISRPRLLNSRFLIGMLCVTSGVALCVISKPH